MLKDPPSSPSAASSGARPRELIAKLAGAQTGQSSTPCRAAARSIITSSRSIPRRRSFVGPALTCECGANDNLAILAALVIAQPGDVIIAACDGFSATAVRRRQPGDDGQEQGRRRHRHRRHGARPRRHRGGGLPVFARGITPNSCVRSGPGQARLRHRLRRRRRRAGRHRAGRPRRRGGDPAGRARGGGRPRWTRSAAWKRRRRRRSAPA